MEAEAEPRESLLRLMNQRRATGMGVVRQEVKRSAGKSGLVGRLRERERGENCGSRDGVRVRERACYERRRARRGEARHKEGRERARAESVASSGFIPHLSPSLVGHRTMVRFTASGRE